MIQSHLYRDVILYIKKYIFSLLVLKIFYDILHLLVMFWRWKHPFTCYRMGVVHTRPMGGAVLGSVLAGPPDCAQGRPGQRLAQVANPMNWNSGRLVRSEAGHYGTLYE